MTYSQEYFHSVFMQIFALTNDEVIFQYRQLLFFITSLKRNLMTDYNDIKNTLSLL